MKISRNEKRTTYADKVTKERGRCA